MEYPDMLEINREFFFIKIKDYWWAKDLHDIDGFHKITFHNCENVIHLNGFQRETFYTHVIDLTQNTDEIWKKFSKSSCRYAINKAIRDGIKIKIDQNYDDFYLLNKKFREKKGLQLNIDSIDTIKKCYTLFVAEYRDEIIGGQVYLNDDQHMRWLLGASKRLEVNSHMVTIIGNANRFLIWTAIQHAKANGLKEFDLGGYYLGESENKELENINKFKKSFGGVLKEYYIYEKYYSKTFQMACKIFESCQSFFV